MGRQILFYNAPVTKFITRDNDPETYHRVKADPPMHFILPIITRVLIFIINLEINQASTIEQENYIL